MMDRWLNKILCGDCLDILKTMPDGLVSCVVTSPPYWGLRDYGIPPTSWPAVTYSPMAGLPEITIPAMECCHGLEPDPLSYVGHEVLIFREVYRILRGDGNLWLNLGDCYATDGGGGAQGKTGLRADRRHTQQTLLKKRITRPQLDGCGKTQDVALRADEAGRVTPNLKPKDLVGMPWRLALALQADGWYLRSDIIWHKPCPMPESVKDRPTRAHEYLFLLSKSERYYYDYESIQEKASPDTHARYARGRSNDHKWADGGPGNQTIARTLEHMRKQPGVNPKATENSPGCRQNASFSAAVKDVVEWRNKRTVWTVPPQPFPEAHFATFPEALVRPCILAGCPENGIVLDPFFGAGTTGVVCTDLGRNYIGIELNPEYVAMAEERIARATAQTRMFV